jgi:hypothetical protein
MSPCRGCEAICCRYFALQIDTPVSRSDFENIRWYISHKKVKVYVEKRKWYLEVMNECRFLTGKGNCSIYDKRPLICREHDVSDCEYTAGQARHDMVFEDLRSLDSYIKKRFAGRPKKK